MMKKKIHTRFLCAAAFATMFSCVKTSDIALFTHMNNLSVVAEFNPEMGIPVGYGNLKAEDLLKDFDFSGHNVVMGTGDNGVMTFSYDTSWNGHFTFGSKTSTTHSDTLVDEITLDLFDAMEGIVNDVDLKEILMDMNCQVTPNLNSKGRQLISNPSYGVQVTFKNITLIGVGTDGSTFTIREFTTPTIYDDDIAANGFHWTVLDDYDVAPWIKNDMQKMRVSVVYEAAVGNVEALVAGEGLTPAQAANINGWIDQNVTLGALDIDADIHADIPLKCHVANLKQTVDVNFNVNDFLGGSGEGEDANRLADAINFGVDEGSLVVEVVNAMPLDVDLNFTVDSNGLLPYTLMQAPRKVAGARMQRNGDSYYSQDTTHTVLDIPLNSEVMSAVRRANQMHVVANVNSGTNTMPGAALDPTVPVAVRNTDKMQLRLYIKAKTNINVDLSVKNNPVK